MIATGKVQVTASNVIVHGRILNSTNLTASVEDTNLGLEALLQTQVDAEIKVEQEEVKEKAIEQMAAQFFGGQEIPEEMKESLKGYVDKYLQENNLRNCNGLFVSTAHPIKFKDTVENSINSQIEYPDSIRSIMNKEKSTLTMKSYSELKEYLIQKD